MAFAERDLYSWKTLRANTFKAEIMEEAGVPSLRFGIKKSCARDSRRCQQLLSAPYSRQSACPAPAGQWAVPT